MPAGSISPIPLPRRVRTVLLFGGMFDPPHLYHTIGPLAAATRLFPRGGWVLYVPTAKSPLKPEGPGASDHDRLAMLRLALDAPGPRSIWCDELERGGPCYTIDTIRRARRVLPRHVELRLLIGSDQAAQFHRWKDFRSIIRLAEPVVMLREPIVRPDQLYSALDEEAWRPEERAAWCTRLAPNFPMPASSTALRDAIRTAPRDAGKWADRPPLDTVNTAVARYIIEHRLYGFGVGRATSRASSGRRRGRSSPR